MRRPVSGLGGIGRLAAALAALVVVPGFAAAQEGPGSPMQFVPAFDTDMGNIFTDPAMLVEMPGHPGYFAVPEMSTGHIWLLIPDEEGYAKTLFATVQVNQVEKDMGLTGFAFHPDYTTNGKYYVKRGLPSFSPRRNVLEEYVAAPDRLKESGDPPRRLLAIDEPSEFRDHNGGAPVFGPDGFLYLGLGDGGWDLATPDPFANGQNLKTLLGKILRIDVDHRDPGREYAIPRDNPFASDPDPEVRGEIWAYGLRNPFRISFDPLTGELYAGDVGSDRFEEVNVIRKGGNYGWSGKEGNVCLPEGDCPEGMAASEKPALYLKNGGDAGQAKCIIGGVVYRGDPESPFYGTYFFGDYTLQRVYAFRKDPAGAATEAALIGNPPSPPIAFTLDRMNRIYLVGLDGYIYKLDHPRLKEAALGIKPRLSRTERAARGRAWVAAYARAGRVLLPRGLRGSWSAYTPAGAFLGTVSDAGGLAAGREGLVLLRPRP